jgi:hypothetical protein
MMHLLAIPNMIGAHLGGWRHATAYDDPVMNLPRMIEYAQLAERGKLDGLFLADGKGIRDMDKPALFAANFPSARPGVFDPVVLMTALAGHTEQIGLVCTATTTFEEPWFVARRFASLDHVSRGRAGWNAVTASNAGDALNFSHAQPVAGHVAPAIPRRIGVPEAVVGQFAIGRRTVPAQAGRHPRNTKPRLLHPEQEATLVNRKVLKAACGHGRLLVPTR